MKIDLPLDIRLLENYDYVYDMKFNHSHSNESLAKLFGISLSAVKTRASKLNLPKSGRKVQLRHDKLDTSKPILEYSINTITKSPILSKRLEDETPILNVYTHANNKHRFHFLKNNLKEIPKCTRCDNNAGLDDEYEKNVFYKYCSHACNSGRSKITEDKEFLLKNKEWLVQKRITEKLSYQSIGDLIGVSYATVNRYIEFHNIDDARYTWKDTKSEEEIDVLQFLKNKTKAINVFGEALYNKINDRDFLFDQYITKRRPASHIAKDLGVLDSTIRQLLLQYEITDNFNRRYFNTKSLEELEMYDFIKLYFPNAISGYRKLYIGLELDIYIKELNLGFEYNGCYNHSEDRRDKNYHPRKLDYFNNFGIRVVQIWGDDWQFHKDKMKAMILNRLGIVKKTIHARKCVVKNITSSEYKKFLIMNHSLSGNNCGTRLGLFNQEKLVAVMGFNILPENRKKVGYDLCRFSTLDVHGSFSKLLKHFRNLHLDSIIYSIADLEIVDKTSNVYLSNGFVKDYDIPIDYQYYNSKLKIRQHKSTWRKKNFTKVGLNITNKTEAQLAKEYKLLRCYDSGKIMYKLLP